MLCFCHLNNVTDKQIGGSTPYFQRFGYEFHGPIAPFGCEVSYKPTSPSDVDMLAKFGSKTLAGIFLGYELEAGGAWTGDVKLLHGTNLKQQIRYEI